MIGLGIGLKFGGAVTLDPATTAFITAAGITDPTQINAINRLVLNYKGQGNLNTSVDLWTGTTAIYPFVGGTATTHKFNLKDPRDLDAAFRLSFGGGWTHNANGITGNATNTFANTFLNANSGLSNSNSRVGVYSRTDGNQPNYDMGCILFTNELMISARFTNLFYVNYGTSTTYGTVSNTDSRGMFVANRLGASNTTGYKNGNLVITHAETETRPNLNIYIGAANNNGIVFLPTSRNYAFSVIGNIGLSDANSLLEYQIIQQFQTDLGRNV